MRSVVCPTCGEPVTPGALFCPKDKTKISEMLYRPTTTGLKKLASLSKLGQLPPPKPNLSKSPDTNPGKEAPKSLSSPPLPNPPPKEEPEEVREAPSLELAPKLSDLSSDAPLEAENIYDDPT